MKRDIIEMNESPSPPTNKPLDGGVWFWQDAATGEYVLRAASGKEQRFPGPHAKPEETRRFWIAMGLQDAETICRDRAAQYGTHDSEMCGCIEACADEIAEFAAKFRQKGSE